MILAFLSLGARLGVAGLAGCFMLLMLTPPLIGIALCSCDTILDCRATGLACSGLLGSGKDIPAVLMVEGGAVATQYPLLIPSLH